jgi:hypothetical protein
MQWWKLPLLKVSKMTELLLKQIEKSIVLYILRFTFAKVFI